MAAAGGLAAGGFAAGLAEAARGVDSGAADSSKGTDLAGGPVGERLVVGGLEEGDPEGGDSAAAAGSAAGVDWGVVGWAALHAHIRPIKKFNLYLLWLQQTERTMSQRRQQVLMCNAPQHLLDHVPLSQTSHSFCYKHEAFRIHNTT